MYAEIKSRNMPQPQNSYLQSERLTQQCNCNKANFCLHFFLISICLSFSDQTIWINSLNIEGA